MHQRNVTYCKILRIIGISISFYHFNYYFSFLSHFSKCIILLFYDLFKITFLIVLTLYRFCSNCTDPNRPAVMLASVTTFINVLLNTNILVYFYYT